MNNYMKTIISGLKQWVSSQKSDWNQNDSSAANFIKNKPFYSEEKERVLFSKTIIVLDTGDEIPYVELGSQLSLIVGRRYEVTIDGVKYSCVAYEYSDWNAICIGNGELVGAPNGNGEPFLIDTYDDGEGYFNAVAGTYNVSISSTVEVVHQIDSKYVPMPELADVAHSGNYYDLIDAPTIPWDIVRYASSQSLTDGNKKIARNNIGASSATNLENGLSSNSLRSTTSDENIGSYAVALGYGVEASSDYSFAEGRNTKACGVAAHAEGDITVASGQMSHAEGWRTLAFNSYTHAEGRDGAAFGSGSHVEGEGSRVPLNMTGAANAVEYSTNTADTSSYLNGKFAYNNQIFTIVGTSGSNVTLDKTMSSSSAIDAVIVFVYNHYASGLSSHAEGVGTIADSKMQHVQGQYNIVDSDDKYAHIVGNGLTNKNRSNAHTLDWNGLGWFKGGLKVGGTSQDDQNAVEVALKTEATTSTAGLMSASDKIKVDNIATNLKDGTAVGSLRGHGTTSESSTYSLGSYAIALGRTTEASGSYSYAEGTNTKATKDGAHAEGSYTTASGNYSHAEGNHTTASSGSAHSEGAYTTASAGAAHAEGSETLASATYSHAEGKGTTAASENQHAQGKWNIVDSADKYAHIVGNGYSDTTRSNAHTIDWNGVGWFKGGIKVGGTGQDDTNASSVISKKELDARVPVVTSTDNGKFLRVVNGVWAASTVPNAEEESF